MATDYGSDISCTIRTVILPMPDGTTRAVTAAQPTLDMAEVSGRTQLAEALVRRLVTYRGTLVDVVIPSTTANYGENVTGWVGDDLDARQLAMVGAAIDAQLEQDERVVRSTTSATVVGNILMLAITIEDGTGPFALVLAVSNVNVQLLTAPS